MPRDVFISHSSRDQRVSERLCELLEQKGKSCWIAPRDIRGGWFWAGSLTEAVRNSKLLLVLVSSSANESKGVARELAVADAEQVPFLFVRIEDVKPEKNIEFFGAGQQWVDAFHGPLEDHILQIVAAIDDVPPPPEPEPSFWRGLRANWGKLCGGAVILAAIIVSLVWVSKKSPCGTDYRVHLALFDDQGTRFDAAEVKSNSSGSITKLAKGWEIRVPRRRQPPGGRLNVKAESLDGMLSGGTELRLGSACEPDISIQLQRVPPTTVSGTITDSEDRLIEGARVSVEGHEDEAIMTGANGSFSLPAHQPAGTLVVIRVQKKGYQPVAEHRYAGPDPAKILLER